MTFSRHHLPWLIATVALSAIVLWPVPASILRPDSAESVRILDRHETLLYEQRPKESGARRQVTLQEIPASVINALIATEDRAFRTHLGVNFASTLRAATQNLLAGRVVSGGSTITQQLIRIRLASRNRSFITKLREAFYALKLDVFLSKDDILAAYLNSAYFGHQAYGIASASHTFFGKTPRELSVAESAFLIGLLQSPTSLDPFQNYAKARDRQRRVLSAMREEGHLTADQEAEESAEPITLARDAIAIRAPHFVFWVQSMRPDAFTQTSGEIRTTLDLKFQTVAEDAVARQMEVLKNQNVQSASVVVLDAKTGDVLAMVGSSDYFDSAHHGAVNVATSPRQPGSALKPFTYALALSNGETAATTVADIESQFFTQEGNPYTPRNYDYGYHGLVRYREALANSYNIAAVKVLERIGVGQLISFLKAAGVTTLTRSAEDYGLALTLGDAEVELIELTRAYAVFARGGVTLPLRLLKQDRPETGESILDPKVAWLITDILSDNAARLPEFGVESPLQFDRPVATKTGTTRNSRDNWTIGFSPEYIVGVWVGNADNSPMIDTSGVTGAGPIFHTVMESLLATSAPSAFPKPGGLVTKEICRLSGKLPTSDCPERILETFIAGTEPTEEDDLFRKIKIDRRNGLLASTYCDQSFVLEKGFTIFPKELTTWASQNGWPLPPTRHSPLCKPPDDANPENTQSWIEIVRPHDGDSFMLDPLIPDAKENVRFEAVASSDISVLEWRVNGTLVKKSTSPDFLSEWRPTPGTFLLEATSGTLRESIRFEVKE